MTNRQRILIVDDDENIAKLISLYLTKEFFDTKIVTDGVSALKEQEIWQPNLILLDLMLPGVDGYQVCRELIINLRNYSVIYRGEPVDMPPKELELLYFLASSPNQVFTREQLLDHIWGYEYMGDTRTVDVHIKRIREKIKDNQYWSITTVWGIGYKFETAPRR